MHTQVLSHPESNRQLTWLRPYSKRMSQSFQHSTYISSKNLVDFNWAPSAIELSAYQLYSWSIYARLIWRGRGFTFKAFFRIVIGLLAAMREALAILLIPRIGSLKKRQAQRVLDINACYVDMGNFQPSDCDWVVNLEDDAEPIVSTDQIVQIIGACIKETSSNNLWLIDLSESFSSEELHLANSKTLSRRTFATSLKTYDLPYLACNTFCAFLIPVQHMREISGHLKKFSSKPVLRLLPCDWVLLVLGFEKKEDRRSYLAYEGQLFTQGSLRGR